jgi:glycosyltransferase involved in cell wall biosynthesis
MDSESLTGAQDQSWAADRPAQAIDQGGQRPRVLVFSPSPDSLDLSAAPLIVSRLVSEGWSAETCGRDGVDQALSLTKPSHRAGITSFRNLVRRLSFCDVAHITGASAGQILKDALPTLVLARFLGKRTVLHFVTPEIETLLEKHRRLLSPVLKLADVRVVGSRHLQKALTRVGLSASVLVAPVSPDGVTFRVRKRLQPKILVVTALEPDANVQAAVRAFRLVKQKYPRAELVVIGEGSQRHNLENLVNRAQIAGVEFRGKVAVAGVARVMDECDLFLHAPLADESPTALVKAFAAGLPVVTSDADGLLHMVRDRVNALIVPIGDHVGLSDAMLELVENEELCIKLSEQGRIEIEKYSWSRVRQDWVNLYNTLRSTS